MILQRKHIICVFNGTQNEMCMVRLPGITSLGAIQPRKTLFTGLFQALRSSSLELGTMRGDALLVVWCPQVLMAL